jgi:hypothetical protein
VRNLLILTIVFLSSIAFGQIKRYNVTGKIIDGTDLPVIGASVVLLNPTDSVMIAFGSSDDAGVFTIKNVKPQKAKFQITYIGFGTISKEIEIGGDKAIFDMGVIKMSDDANLLKEVEIKSEFIPIKIKKDTVEYNADAFRVRPNASVEELLKKLPGVEVADDGTVTAQGETVAKVTVDGKKFFGNDVQMATKNLPADAVKKVQFIDKKSEKAEFSGISDGQTEKVLNLELKDNKKVGTFGDISAGYGTEERYEAGLTLNKFSSGAQIGAIVKLNNQSKQGINFNQYSALTGGSGFSNMGRGGNPPSIVNFNGGSSSGRVESATGGLNIYKEFSKKFNATLSYFLNASDQELIEQVVRQNYLGDQNFTTSTNDTSFNDNNSHNFNLSMQIKADSFHRIDIETSYGLRLSDRVKSLTSLNESTTRTRINENNQKDNSTGDADNFSFRGVFSKRLRKPGRVMTLTTNFANNSNEQVYNILSQSVLLGVRNTLNQNQLSGTGTNNYNINYEYKEPLGKRNYLGLEFQMRNNQTEQDKEFNDIDLLTGQKTLNDILSSLIDNDINYRRATLQYTKDNDNYNINFDLGAQQSVLNSKFSNKNFVPVNNKYFYVLPAFSFNLPKTNLRFRYNKTVDEPSATQLQSIVDNSNPLNIYRGNPNLVPESNHNFSLRYFFFDNFNFRNLFSSLNYRYTTDRIVNAQKFGQNLVRETSPVNVENNQNVSFNVGYGSPLKPLGVKTRINTRFTYNKGINFINGIVNNVTTLSPGGNLELENIKNTVVSLLASYGYNLNRNRYDINTQNNTDFATQVLRSTLLTNLGKGWMIDGDINHNIYSKEQFGDENTLTLANAAVTKNFMKNRLALKVRVEDMFNVGQGINRNATETYLEEVTSNAIGRFFMLSATYKLNAFGGGPAAGSAIHIMR